MLEDEIKEYIFSTVTKILDIKKIKDVTFADIVSNTEREVKNLGVSLIETLYKSIDDDYENARETKNVWVRNRNKTRTVITSLGAITLHHRLYFDKQTQHYFFAADKLLDMEPRSRIEKTLQAALVKQATLSSYAKASAISNNAVSRQSIFNLVKHLKNIEVEEHRELRKVDSVYVEADEDHIHMQDATNREVRLVYVHEGVKTECKDRTSLRNVHYFTSMSSEPDKLWNDVALYISNTYSPCAKIHLSGDGAEWIKAGRRVLYKAEYHLDKFHVYKSITSATFGDKLYRKAMINALLTKDGEYLTKLYSLLYNRHSEDRSKRKVIFDNYSYIRNNFSAIDLSRDSLGCSAEGHVSHILSSRLSSRPMGWSEAGAERMAKLRCYLFNNGDFLRLIDMKNITKIDEQDMFFKKKPNNVTNCLAENSLGHDTYSLPITQNGVTWQGKIIKSMLK